MFGLNAAPLVYLYAVRCTEHRDVQADEIKVRMAEKRMMTKAKAIQSYLTQRQYVHSLSVECLVRLIDSS